MQHYGSDSDLGVMFDLALPKCLLLPYFRYTCISITKIYGLWQLIIYTFT